MRAGENLRSQDVLVACKIFALGAAREEPSYARLARDLAMSTSTAHEATERCRRAQLLPPSAWTVNVAHLRDVLVVAVPRVFYVVRGEVTVGMPTGTGAPPIAGRFRPSPGALPQVWAGDVIQYGVVRGERVAPIYPTVPQACREDAVLYELLALVDVIRLGVASDRAIATQLIEKRLGLKENVKG